jgi:hypothetical protein
VPADVANGDTWLQDQFQSGIAVGSDGWRHVIVHMPRMRSNFYGAQSTSNLASFVTSHFPSPNVCLIDDFWKRELKFTDATGTHVTLSFRDCIRLSNLMSRLPALVRNLDDTSAMIDENFQAHWLTWPDMRAQLPNIVDQFVQRAKNAMRKERAAWKLTLQD